MSDVERLLRERLQRADLPRAPEDLRVALDTVVRTPVDGRDREDRLGPLRLLAVAALIVTGGVAMLVAGGGLPQRPAIAPNPIPTRSTPPATPSAVPLMSVAELASVANLRDPFASTCRDTGGTIQDIPSVGAAIRCSDGGLTIEVAQVSAVGESGDPLTAIDVWNRLAYQPADQSVDEPWNRGDASICSSQARASFSDYAVGTRQAGRVGGCTDEGWLIWTIEGLGIVGRIEPATGALADAVAWFRSNRPIGGLSGLVWEVPWFACQDAVQDPGCDGPLPAESFETIASLARPVSYEELQGLSQEATDTSDPQLVRLTGRVAFGFVDDGWIGIEVRRISGTSWDQPVMIPDAYLFGPQNGDVIDVVGWVGEQFAMPADSEPSPDIRPSPAYPLPAFLPHVDVAMYRPAK